MEEQPQQEGASCVDRPIMVSISKAEEPSVAAELPKDIPQRREKLSEYDLDDGRRNTKGEGRKELIYARESKARQLRRKMNPTTKEEAGRKEKKERRIEKEIEYEADKEGSFVWFATRVMEESRGGVIEDKPQATPEGQGGQAGESEEEDDEEVLYNAVLTCTRDYATSTGGEINIFAHWINRVQRAKEAGSTSKLERLLEFILYWLKHYPRDFEGDMGRILIATIAENYSNTVANKCKLVFFQHIHQNPNGSGIVFPPKNPSNDGAVHSRSHVLRTATTSIQFSPGEGQHQPYAPPTAQTSLNLSSSARLYVDTGSTSGSRLERKNMGLRWVDIESNSIDFKGTSPRAIARALTVAEADLFLAIDCREFVGQGWQLKSEGTENETRQEKELETDKDDEEEEQEGGEEKEREKEKEKEEDEEEAEEGQLSSEQVAFNAFRSRKNVRRRRPVAGSILRKGPLYNNSGEAPNIIRMIQHFNKVSTWIATEILQIKTSEGRAKTIQKFIKVAKKMWQLFHNFNGLMEVLGALQMHPVDRLRRSWGPLLSERSLDTRAEIERLMDARMNFKAYREAFAEIQGSKIPFMALLLKDFTLCCEGNAKHDESGRVNVDRLRLLGKMVVSVQRLQSGCRYSSGHNNTHKDDAPLCLVAESDEELMRLSDKYLEKEKESAAGGGGSGGGGGSSGGGGGGGGGPMASLTSFLSSSSEHKRRSHSPTQSLSASSSAISTASSLSTSPSSSSSLSTSSSSTPSSTPSASAATVSTNLSTSSSELKVWKGLLAKFSPRKKGEGEEYLDDEGMTLRRSTGSTSPRGRDFIIFRTGEKPGVLIKKSLSADDASFSKVDNAVSTTTTTTTTTTSSTASAKKEKRMSAPFNRLHDVLLFRRDVDPVVGGGVGKEEEAEEVQEEKDDDSIEEKRENEEEKVVVIVDKDVSPRQHQEQPPSPHLEGPEDRISPRKKKANTKKKRLSAKAVWREKVVEKEKENKGNRKKGKGKGKGKKGRGSGGPSSTSTTTSTSPSTQKKKKEIVLLTKKSRSEGTLDDLKKLHQVWKERKEPSPRQNHKNGDSIVEGGSKKTIAV